MGFWAYLWGTVFFLGIGVFAVMAVWVTVAGFRDIRSLFASLEKSHKEHETDSE